MNGSTLKDKTARGLLWAAINSGGTQVLNLVIGIFLARLLSPGEYGVVGMLALFTAIAGCLQDSGFTQALINRKSPSQHDYNSVFWFNITVSLSLYVLLFSCAPLIARWFHQPELVGLSRFLFITFVLSALGIVPNAILVRQLRQREKAAISLTALSLSGITGIVLALRGYSYWSLAWQQMVYNLITLAGRLACTRWVPTGMGSMQPIREMFGFSSRILLTAVVNALNTNLLTVVFGRMYRAHDVGNYTQASKWEVMGHSFVSNTIAQVVQPVIAELDSSFVGRQHNAFRKMVRFTAFLTFPSMFGLAAVSHDFILLTITSKWEAAIPLLQVLSMGGAALPFHTLFQQLAVGRGRSDVYMWCTVGLIVAQLAVVLAMRGTCGIATLVLAYAVLNILWLMVWQLSAGRLISLRLAQLLRDILPFAIVAAAAVAAACLFTTWIDTMWLRLTMRIVLAAALYVAAMHLLRVKIFSECVDFLIKRK